MPETKVLEDTLANRTLFVVHGPELSINLEVDEVYVSANRILVAEGAGG